MKPTYTVYPFFLENADNLGDFDENFHDHLRDRLRQDPLLLQEATIAVLETFSDYHYPQIGPVYNPLIYIGLDVSIDINLHCRTILQDCNIAALVKLLIALKSATGAVRVRFIYGDFPGDCAIAQWDFARRSWRIKK